MINLYVFNKDIIVEILLDYEMKVQNLLLIQLS
jgi:hypothetical protein